MTRFEDDYIWECYNSLLLSHDLDRVRKLVIRYDLFRMAIDVPGDIVECGVFKGVGLMYWLKLLAIYNPSALKRVIGFDTFTEFSTTLLAYEKKSATDYVQESNYQGVETASLLNRTKDAGLEHSVELVQGDLEVTAAKYVEDNPGFRISLLNLDLDTYSGTKAALEAFYPMVSRSGIIILDEYGCRGWGESDAVDEFLADKKADIRTIPNSTKPTAYIVKS